MLWLTLSTALPCESWGPLTALTPIRAIGLEESSGIATSRLSPGQLWTHDDDGPPRLFRFGIDGVATAHDVPEADLEDWEDLASASCPGSGECLYIADIGAERDDPTLQVYVVREPEQGNATLRELWNLEWPNGPRDAETLLVHPCTLKAWILTRGSTTEIYAIDDARGPTATTLSFVGAVDLEEVTGGDFSPDGTAVIVRTRRAAWIWQVDPDDLDAHWTTAPVQLVDGLVPGEGITWELDGDILLTSEGSPTPLGRLTCESSAPPACEPPAGCGCRTTGAPWGACAGLGLSVLLRRRRRSR